MQTACALTQFEASLAIGLRATQLECSAQPMIVPHALESYIALAERELLATSHAVLPMLIQRAHTDGTYEYVSVCDGLRLLRKRSDEAYVTLAKTPVHIGGGAVHTTE